LRAGDEAASELIVRRYGPRLLAVARRLLGNDDDARDALQDGFLSAFRSIGSFAEGSRLSTWLHRIVVNAALMRLRSRRRRAEDSIEELLPRFAADGHWLEAPRSWRGEEALESQEIRALVRGCIAQLPPRHRTVLVLRDIEDLDTAEVAGLLGITPNAVKVRLHRARQALRTLIERARPAA
jgi:RNA polymerase sigma-70 factor (ECF subfamily)